MTAELFAVPEPVPSRLADAIEAAIAREGSATGAAVRLGLPLMLVLPLWAQVNDWNVRPLQPCGTTAAYHRHRRRGEVPDTDCRRAHAQQAAIRRARTKEAA